MQRPNANNVAIAPPEEGRDHFVYHGGEGEVIPRDVTRVKIHSSVRVIKNRAFSGCSGLTTLTLGNGLEKIGAQAFDGCRSLRAIVIPNAVREIDGSAFLGCTNLTRVRFCDEIEQFVSCDAMRGWWNQGVGYKSLSTYCFLVRCNIIERLSFVRVPSWQSKIYKMLERISSIHYKGMESYFLYIDSRLKLYDDLKDKPTLLELWIWQSKITKKFGPSNILLTPEMKMQCRTESLMMVNIVVRNVMTFLTGGDDGHPDEN